MAERGNPHRILKKLQGRWWKIRHDQVTWNTYFFILGLILTYLLLYIWATANCCRASLVLNNQHKTILHIKTLSQYHHHQHHQLSSNLASVAFLTVTQIFILTMTCISWSSVILFMKGIVMFSSIILTMLRANSAEEKLMIFFFISFLGSDTSCANVLYHA